MTVRLSTSPLVWSDPEFQAPGLLDVAWIRPGHRCVPAPDRAVDLTTATFLARVWELAAKTWSIGTVYTLAVHDACDPGEWHRDSGGAQRFAACVAADGRDVSQEFYPGDLPHGYAPGYVAAYTDQFHRRPAAPAGWRIFCSAALYSPGQFVELSCSRLAALRVPATAS